ncbi:MAG: hypothetical protein R3D33_03210 [Hyphomicrobiaceae bacterium]
MRTSRPSRFSRGRPKAQRRECPHCALYRRLALGAALVVGLVYLIDRAFSTTGLLG